MAKEKRPADIARERETLRRRHALDQEFVATYTAERDEEAQKADAARARAKQTNNGFLYFWFNRSDSVHQKRAMDAEFRRKVYTGEFAREQGRAKVKANAELIQKERRRHAEQTLKAIAKLRAGRLKPHAVRRPRDLIPALRPKGPWPLRTGHVFPQTP